MQEMFAIPRDVCYIAIVLERVLVFHCRGGGLVVVSTVLQSGDKLLHRCE